METACAFAVQAAHAHLFDHRHRVWVAAGCVWRVQVTQWYTGRCSEPTTASTLPAAKAWHGGRLKTLPALRVRRSLSC